MYLYIANNLENLHLMNHWPECFLNWHETCLGQGALILFKWNPYGHWLYVQVDQMHWYLVLIIFMKC